MDIGEKPNIVFVAGMHGNERMPIQALTDAGIDFILGNPKAYKSNIRFTERDLNASFGVNDGTYESKRATELLKEISDDELVVDFHTTDAAPPPFVIVVDESMIPLAATTGLEHVVIMKHNIKNHHALINVRHGISIETGAHGYKQSYWITRDITRSVLQKKMFPINLYEVYDELREPGDYINFQLHQQGFIPILAHEPAYERHGLYGLKARKV